MIILGVDSSALVSSCAVCKVEKKLIDSEVLASFTINTKLTHSQTLMPMIEEMMKNSKISFDQVDAFAVSIGPGSFTGLRIGISTVKGMAFPLDKPCYGVSTLEGLASNMLGNNCIVAPVMDARRNQVYNGIFKVEGEKITRLTQDRAISISELGEELQSFSQPVILIGDGAKLVYNSDKVENVVLAPPALRIQSAVSVAFSARNISPISASQLMPSYLRLPQAERELLEKQKGTRL